MCHPPRPAGCRRANIERLSIRCHILTSINDVSHAGKNVLTFYEIRSVRRPPFPTPAASTRARTTCECGLLCEQVGGGAIDVVPPAGLFAVPPYRDAVVTDIPNLSGNCFTMPSDKASDMWRMWSYTASKARTS